VRFVRSEVDCGEDRPTRHALTNVASSTPA
jgi:hypothetical protein